MSARRSVGRVKFSQIGLVLRDGIPPTEVARRFGVPRSVVAAAAEAYGVDLAAASAAEAAEREAARAAKATARAAARAAREAARAKRKAEADAAAATRAAAKMERRRKALDLTLELLRAGRPPREIAAELGVTPGRVRQVAQAHAIPLPRLPRPHRPRGQVVSLRSAAGQELLATAIDLARELGVTPQAVVLAGAWALGHGRVVIDSAGDTLDHDEAIGILRRGLAAIASGGQPADVARVVSEVRQPRRARRKAT